MCVPFPQRHSQECFWNMAFCTHAKLHIQFSTILFTVFSSFVLFSFVLSCTNAPCVFFFHLLFYVCIYDIQFFFCNSQNNECILYACNRQSTEKKPKSFKYGFYTNAAHMLLPYMYTIYCCYYYYCVSMHIYRIFNILYRVVVTSFLRMSFFRSFFFCHTRIHNKETREMCKTPSFAHNIILCLGSYSFLRIVVFFLFLRLCFFIYRFFIFALMFSLTKKINDMMTKPLFWFEIFHFPIEKILHSIEQNKFNFKVDQIRNHKIIWYINWTKFNIFQKKKDFFSVFHHFSAVGRLSSIGTTKVLLLKFLNRKQVKNRRKNLENCSLVCPVDGIGAVPIAEFYWITHWLTVRMNSMLWITVVWRMNVEYFFSLRTFYFGRTENFTLLAQISV